MKNFIAIAAIAGTLLSHASAQTAESLYNEGVKLREEKKSAEALVKFRQAVSIDKNYYAALYEIGWCSNDVKDYTGAMSSLRKARVGWSNIPKVHFELGYAFDKLNMTDSAIVSYTECLRLKPDYSLAHKQLGLIDYAKDRYADALAKFASYIYHSKNEITDYLFWYRKGFCENAEKKFTEAKESLQKSLSFKKDYINTYLELGFACSRLKDADGAINWYNEAIKLDPQSHIGYNGIGEVYRDVKKDIDMAISWYKKTLEVKPGERKAHFGLGYCFNSKGRYDEAITNLKKAIESEPDYTAAYVELGYSYYMTGRNADALAQFQKALELNPKNENARYYAGLVYINQRDKTKAQQMATELQQLASKNAAALQEKVNKM